MASRLALIEAASLFVGVFGTLLVWAASRRAMDKPWACSARWRSRCAVWDRST